MRFAGVHPALQIIIFIVIAGLFVRLAMFAGYLVAPDQFAPLGLRGLRGNTQQTVDIETYYADVLSDRQQVVINRWDVNIAGDPHPEAVFVVADELCSPCREQRLLIFDREVQRLSVKGTIADVKILPDGVRITEALPRPDGTELVRRTNYVWDGSYFVAHRLGQP